MDKLGTCAFCNATVACDAQGTLARHGWQANTSHCRYGQLGATHGAACQGRVAVEKSPADLRRLLDAVTSALLRATDGHALGVLTPRQAQAQARRIAELQGYLPEVAERLVQWVPGALANREAVKAERKAVAQAERQAKADAKAARDAAKAERAAKMEAARAARMDAMRAVVEATPKGEVVTYKALRAACKAAGLKAPTAGMLEDALDDMAIAANGGERGGCAKYMRMAYEPHVEAQAKAAVQKGLERYEVTCHHKPVGFYRA